MSTQVLLDPPRDAVREVLAFAPTSPPKCWATATTGSRR